MVFCDCIELARSVGRHLEGVLTMALLMSTLLLLCKLLPLKFSLRVKLNHGIGNADLNYCGIYHLACLIQFLYCHVCVL